MSDQNKYAGLLERLEKDGPWPKLYFFKFIIPNDNRKLAMTEQLFGPEAHVTINKSRKGNYLSISAKEVMVSPKEVVTRYTKAEKIEGLIPL